MGLDYIRAQTGKPWRKRWDGGLDRLKTPTQVPLIPPLAPLVEGK
jgi:hypothetical protein